MFDSIGLQEGTEFFRTELRSVVAHKDVRNSMATEKSPEHLYGLAGCGAVHDMHLRPLGMGVHSDQVHMTFEWTRKVHIYPFPRTGWSHPRV